MTYSQPRNLQIRRNSPRAVLAGLAGVGLLAGSGATFALWNSDATLQPDYMVLGLSVRADTLNWFDISDGRSLAEGGAPISRINDFVLVPGDTLEASGSITSTLVGEELVADLTLGNWQALPPWVDHRITFLDDAGQPLVDPATGYPVTSLRQTQGTQVNVRVYLAFPPGAAAHLEHRQDQLSLQNLQVSLQQVIQDE